MNRSFLSVIVAIAGIACAVAIQKYDNHLVIKECDKSINTITSVASGVGSINYCVSSVRMNGPSTPLKD